VRSLAVVVAVIALASSCSDWRADVNAWKPGAPLPSSLPLVDASGRSFVLGELSGKPLAIGFVFSHCAVPTACPLTMAKLAEVSRSMRVLVVSIDPERDTPAVLHEYGARYGVSDASLATGDGAESLASLFNVVSLGGAHPVKTAVLDERLRVKRVFADNNFTSKEIVDAAVAQ
jgi:protein SCO1